jgi:hypothetical protein
LAVNSTELYIKRSVIGRPIEAIASNRKLVGGASFWENRPLSDGKGATHRAR